MGKKPKRIKQRSLVGMIGKELTRRSRGRCELCGQPGGRPWELPPFPVEPDPDRSLMLCERCTSWMERGHPDADEHHLLSEVAWSDLPPVRLAAARLIFACEASPDWIRESLDDIDPATGEYRPAREPSAHHHEAPRAAL
ncbi:MAG: hypothetical protein JXX28_01180 [Deltaproteobacteria bacterium]|nr:hypothetical protein [Deltaproteobacteria bacterium]